jgi:hypothetical protein
MGWCGLDGLVKDRNRWRAVVNKIINFLFHKILVDRLCGLVVRFLDYRCRGPGFDSQALQKKSSGSGTGCTQPREYN